MPESPLSFSADPVANTLRLQSAIDATSSGGGGIILLPTGAHPLGSVELRSGITLVVPGGCVLQASRDHITPDARITEGANVWPEAPRAWVKAFGAKDVTICGGGRWHGPASGPPSYLTFLRDCQDVAISHTTWIDSTFWTLCFFQCRDLHVHDLFIDAHCAPHNDGIDLVSCRSAVLERLDIDADDDAICLKTTGGHSLESILIQDCTVRTHCNGIKVGTQTTGDVRNVTVRRCRVLPSRIAESCFFGYPNAVSGLSLQMNEGHTLENILCEDIAITGTQVPLFLLHWNREFPGHRPNGSFHDVTLRRISIESDGSLGSALVGHPESPLEKITLDGISIRLLPVNAKAAAFQPHGSASLEAPLPYPDGKMFGPLPAAGLFAYAAMFDPRDLKVDSCRADSRCLVSPQTLQEKPALAGDSITVSAP